MTERPILFSTQMVRAILDGRKTQTRRVVKPQPTAKNFCSTTGTLIRPQHRMTPDLLIEWESPYGQPGDRLWVRESIRPILGYAKDQQGRFPIIYRADQNGFDDDRAAGKPIPSIHMPRWASRILLEIVAVRVERLIDISEADATAEGIETMFLGDTDEMKRLGARVAFKSLWESINGHGSWAANPWVWVIEFKRVTP